MTGKSGEKCHHKQADAMDLRAPCRYQKVCRSKNKQQAVKRDQEGQRESKVLASC